MSVQLLNMEIEQTEHDCISQAAQAAQLDGDKMFRLDRILKHYCCISLIIRLRRNLSSRWYLEGWSIHGTVIRVCVASHPHRGLKLIMPERPHGIFSVKLMTAQGWQSAGQLFNIIIRNDEAIAICLFSMMHAVFMMTGVPDALDSIDNTGSTIVSPVKRWMSMSYYDMSVIRQA